MNAEDKAPDQAVESAAVLKSKLIFRNYQPYDTKLKQLVAKDENETQLANAVDGLQAKVVEMDAIKRELALLKSDEINIVPKKANYDLKKQVEARLEKLKRRTQKAIVEMLREKIALNNDSDQE
jgi:coiled-coil domain-containing protein 12